MKLIGHSIDRRYLLEATPDEFRALRHLAETSNGVPLKAYVSGRDEELDFDLAQSLDWIWSWIELKDKARHLHAVADGLEKLIKPESSE